MWLCVRSYSSVFGEGIMRDERPTSTQNRTEGRTWGEGIYKQQACSPPVSSSLLFPCDTSRAPLSEVPHRAMRAHIFSIGGSTGIAAPAPSLTATTRGGGSAMLCQSSYVGPHTSFLISPFFCSRTCKLLEQRPAFRDSCLGHGCTTCLLCVWTVHTLDGSCSLKNFHLIPKKAFRSLLHLSAPCGWQIGNCSFFRLFHTEVMWCATVGLFNDEDCLRQIKSSNKANKLTYRVEIMWSHMMNIQASD